MSNRVTNGALKLWRLISSVLFALLFLMATSKAAAYETDQLTNRFQPIADSREVLNREVNRAIETSVAEWKPQRGPDQAKFADAITDQIGGWSWVDKIEKFAMDSAEIERLDVPRYDSVYGKMPVWRTRAVWFTGVSKTIQLNDTLIGTDKLGHFVSQGRKFFRRYQKSQSEADAAQRSAFTERAIFGRALAGSYSNADLVANYEGYRFYRSLFEDDVVSGKPAILRWEGDHWVIQREFDWADHVNAYWDEAINVSHYDAMLYGRMMDRFVGFCPDYWRNPESYTPTNEADLKAQYAHLEMRDNSTLRLDSLCPIYAAHLNPTTVAEAQ